MANPEHLALLKEGVAVWNQWRQDHAEADLDFRRAGLWKMNLSGVMLSGANLRKANLNRTKLREATLSSANLSEASLFQADLSSADLNRADLNGANLRRAVLSSADVSETNLSGADLSSANLSKAYLFRADLSGSNLRDTNLSRADLSLAELGGANLLEADLSRADLSGANLSGTDLSRADLRGADCRRATFSSANLRKANLFGAKLGEANLTQANLSSANLKEANLFGANLREANFSEANLTQANLTQANFFQARLIGADLSGADLAQANLVDTDLQGANLTACSVYGISVWNVRLKGAIQSNLLITPAEESAIQVDSLEVAQFIYLLLNNEKIRGVIDTITSKVVLILGRFTPNRIVVLEAIRHKLRKLDYLPVLFDFKKPDSKNLTGTISTLANLARFIIVDLTDPSSVPHELATIIPITRVPVQPIILEGQREYAMFRDLKDYQWVLEPHRYKSEKLLIAQLGERVIAPAEAKAQDRALKLANLDRTRY